MSAAKFWPRESRSLIGTLTIELSTEVNCLRDSLTISIRPPSPRNNQHWPKCCSIKFSSFKEDCRHFFLSWEWRSVWRKLSLTWSREGQQQWIMYSALSHRVSEFSFDRFQLVLKIWIEQWLFPRFTKQNEQQTNKYLSPRMINKSTDNSVNLTVNWCLSRAAIKSQ